MKGDLKSDRRYDETGFYTVMLQHCRAALLVRYTHILECITRQRSRMHAMLSTAKPTQCMPQV